MRIGDRIWTEWDGTCTVHALRVWGTSQFPQGLIEAHAWPGPRDWAEVHEMFCQRLEPGEPDRPPGPQPVRAGRTLRHRRFGIGIVLEVLPGPSGKTTVRIDFGPRHGTHCIALGAGHLRPVSYVPRAGNFWWAVGRDE